MPYALIILAIVLIAIAFRQILSIHIGIWQIFSVGALALLFSQQITPLEAFYSIDWHIIFFLWGMFVVAELMERSGFIQQMLLRWFSGDKSRKRVAFITVFGMGLLSALFLNDTLAIIGVPLVLSMASMLRISPRLLLLGLAYAITIGSVMSPIGNPQNLLIGQDVPIKDPFLIFLVYLGPPTIISLWLLYCGLSYLLRREKITTEISRDRDIIIDPQQMILCKTALILIISMVAFNMVSSLLGLTLSVPLILIALIPAVLLLLSSSSRKDIFVSIDWSTLLFFISLFVMMEGVVKDPLVHAVFSHIGSMVNSSAKIMGLSLIGSQLISNVPLVAITLPILQQYSFTQVQYMALAAGSTLAGMLLIIGAASNIIIIQSAEKKGVAPFSSLDFFKYGLPLTALSFLIYWAYFWCSTLSVN